MDVSATSATTTSTVSPQKTGFNALSSEDFLEMMIVQLQNQDPLEPTGNDELLNQISQMRSLQSSIELGDVLKTVSSQQQLTSAASLIGKTISGSVSRGGTTTTIKGLVERAFMKEGAAYVGTPAGEIAVEDIIRVE